MVGRSERLAPMSDDGSGDFLERYRSSEHGRERRFPIQRGRLRAGEKNRSVLQEGLTPPDLGGAHELASIHDDLAAEGRRETGGATVRRPDGRTVTSQEDVSPQHPQRGGDPAMNLTVGYAE